MLIALKTDYIPWNNQLYMFILSSAPVQMGKAQANQWWSLSDHIEISDYAEKGTGTPTFTHPFSADFHCDSKN